MPIRPDPVGRKKVPIHIRILPQVLHMMEKGGGYIYYYSFLISGNCVMILSTYFGLYITIFGINADQDPA